MSGTHTLVNEFGQLRHGHTSEADPHKVQWHDASTFHRGDPDAHEREASWSQPGWSRNGNHWNFVESERERLIADAHAKHDAARKRALGWSYAPAYGSSHEARPNWISPSETPPVQISSKSEPELEPAATTGDTDTIDVQQLSERITNAEALALGVHQQLATTDGKVSTLESALVGAARQDALEAVNEKLISLEQAQARRVTIVMRGAPQDLERVLPDGLRHDKFELLLRLATALDPVDRNIWIAGPAGAGKTHAAHTLAEALGLPFEYTGAVDTSYKVSGYMNAAGGYVATSLRRMYENGGVWLADEVDGSSPNATLELNAMLANDFASFPDKMVQRHPDFICLAAANTWGHGGDANYVGRNKLDSAFLDRFVTITWPYDPVLERERAQHEVWVRVVQAVRDEATRQGAMFVISPRASIKGAQLLRAGLSRAETVEAIFGRYRSHSAWPKVGKAAEDFCREPAPVQASTNGAVPAASKTNLTVNMNGVRVFGSSR